MHKTILATLVASQLMLAQPAQSQGQKSEIQQRLASLFTLTKTTADKTDIVTSGSSIVLHKDGLVMFRLDAKVPPTTTYKDGKLAMGFGDAMATTMLLGGNQTTSTTPQRKFVSGERFWITAYQVSDKNIILQFYSDPYGNDRYYGQIKFPFPKHNIPPADDVMKTISEVVTAETPDTAANDQTPPDSAPPQAAQEPTRTISLGQTKDEVIAALGQPQKSVNLGAKEIYIFPDMKITFINGKVSDVQ